MNAVILTQSQYETIQGELAAIKDKLNKLQAPSNEQFLDNYEFMALMKISRRTAQAWRDEGLIAYSQLGKKIYYRRSDIDDFLNRHYRNAPKAHTKY